MHQSFSNGVRASIAGLAAIISGLLAAGPLFAQTDLPPIAAPTTSVAVQSLPVVRSESQQVTDYARGLVEGLIERENITFGALVIVSRDRVDMAEVFGDGVSANALFALGSLSDLFGVVSVLQLVDRGRLFPEQDLAEVLGEDAPRDSTLADLLTQRLEAPSSIFEDFVGRVSGVEYGAYISRQVLNPLGMARSRFEDNVGMLVTAGDMSEFLKAFTNQASLEGQSILRSATVERMQRQYYSDHNSLPGWTYGFAEMERNGWRALQRDGQITGATPFQSRVVIVPELQVAFFVSVAGEGSPEFWRALNNNLFDRLAPQRTASGAASSSPSGALEAAMELAGLYRFRPRADDAVFLMAKREPLRIEADGRNLRLSGAEDLVLRLETAGLWRTETTLIPAAFVQGAFRVGNIPYEPVRAWQSAGNYRLLAIFFGMLTIAAVMLRRFAPVWAVTGRFSSPPIVFGLAGLTAVFAALAVALHSWA